LEIKKNWKRILFFLILIPILLSGGLLIYIQSKQSSIIQNQITSLNENYKGKIQVGESELSLFGNFPYVSFKVYDVFVIESKENNSSEILNVNDIYVGFNIWDIVKDNYEIQSLFIEEGDCNIILHENGTTNIQNSLTISSEIETSNSSSNTNIQLENIRLRNTKRIWRSLCKNEFS